MFRIYWQIISYSDSSDAISSTLFLILFLLECASFIDDKFRLLFGPRQANLVLIAYASSEGSGEPAHPRSLARTFAARLYKQ